MKNVILLGQASDPQIQHLQRVIEDTRYTPWVVDTARFGDQLQLSYDPGYDDGMLHINEQTVPFSSITAAYWHVYATPHNCQSDDALASQVAREQASTLQSFFLFKQIRWVNGIEAVRGHQCKPVQLSLARRLGATIPDSYIGNERRIARAFAHHYPNVILKPVRGGQTARLLSDEERSPAALMALLDRTPGTLQEYIPGTNVRSYVFGTDVVSVQIDASTVDFREDPHVTILNTPTPRAVQTLASRICRGFGMAWCAIDWRRRPDGSYFFLEANPCPYFLAVEASTGADLTGRLLSLLLPDQASVSLSPQP